MKDFIDNQLDLFVELYNVLLLHKCVNKIMRNSSNDLDDLHGFSSLHNRMLDQMMKSEPVTYPNNSWWNRPIRLPALFLYKWIFIRLYIFLIWTKNMILLSLLKLLQLDWSICTSNGYSNSCAMCHEYHLHHCYIVYWVKSCFINKTFYFVR